MMRRSPGFSLVEVLISLLIAHGIAFALVHLYLMSKHHHVIEMNKLERSFETLWVTDLMRHSIRQAGFTPCVNVDILQQPILGKGKPYQSITLISNDDKQGIRIQRMHDIFFQVMALPNKDTLVTDGQFKTGEAVLIADCFHAEVLTINTIHGLQNRQHLSFTTPRVFNYEAPVYIGAWIDEQFFTSTRGNLTSLYYQQKQANELSRTIKDLAITKVQQTPHALYRIQLGLDNGESINFATMPRL